MGFKGSHGVFGISPHRNYDNLKRLEEEKGESFNVMVPDCYDGYNVLPMLLRNKKVDCYETNDVLLNGGTIDGFYTIGLKQKVNNYNLNRKVNIYKKNFYTTRIEKEQIKKLKEEDVILILNPGRQGDIYGCTFVIKEEN